MPIIQHFDIFCRSHKVETLGKRRTPRASSTSFIRLNPQILDAPSTPYVVLFSRAKPAKIGLFRIKSPYCREAVKVARYGNSRQRSLKPRP
jgi:hypothetical protein